MAIDLNLFRLDNDVKQLNFRAVGLSKACNGALMRHAFSNDLFRQGLHLGNRFVQSGPQPPRFGGEIPNLPVLLTNQPCTFREIDTRNSIKTSKAVTSFAIALDGEQRIISSQTFGQGADLLSQLAGVVF